MSRRLKSVKDLSVLVLAPRKHDRQLWADLLKNCDIRHPLSMADIKQASITIGSGQVDVVFVDEAYGPKDIANILIPARNVEFAGGRGVCLILCSKKATTQDVLNARKLGFASLVILPASTGTVQKHLELAARYIPMSDEELGWSAPKILEYRESKAMPAPKDDPAHMSKSVANQLPSGFGAKDTASHGARAAGQASAQAEAAGNAGADSSSYAADALSEAQRQMTSIQKPEVPTANPITQTTEPKPAKTSNKAAEEPLERLKAPGRSGTTAEEEVVFL